MSFVGPASRVVFRALGASSMLVRVVGLVLRRALLAAGDPIVPLDWDYGSRLWLPLSHPLPAYRARHPEYDRHLGDVARVVRKQYPEMTAIDIGANIGDSVPQLQSGGNVSVLCVEGNPTYLALLRANTQANAAVRIAPVLVGPAGMTGTFDSRRGTAKVIRASGEGSVPAISLNDLILRFPDFAQARLVKADTDGMDWEILFSGLEWLGEAKPVLFFEHDADLSGMTKEDERTAWARLASVGYVQALFFKNTGEYIGRATVDDADEIERLESRAELGKHGYFDVCVLSAADAQLVPVIERSVTEPPDSVRT